MNKEVKAVLTAEKARQQAAASVKRMSFPSNILIVDGENSWLMERNLRFVISQPKARGIKDAEGNEPLITSLTEEPEVEIKEKIFRTDEELEENLKFIKFHDNLPATTAAYMSALTDESNYYNYLLSREITELDKEDSPITKILQKFGGNYERTFDLITRCGELGYKGLFSYTLSHKEGIKTFRRDISKSFNQRYDKFYMSYAYHVLESALHVTPEMIKARLKEIEKERLANLHYVHMEAMPYPTEKSKWVKNTTKSEYLKNNHIFEVNLDPGKNNFRQYDGKEPAILILRKKGRVKTESTGYVYCPNLRKFFKYDGETDYRNRPTSIFYEYTLGNSH